jgi:hypothetical protein
LYIISDDKSICWYVCVCIYIYIGGLPHACILYLMTRVFVGIYVYILRRAKYYINTFFIHIYIYVVCRESNDTECVARQLASL